MLIVRELLVRPRRYAELLDALPGIGTNLLADRLHFLVGAGLVHLVDPDDRRSGYRLTERGLALHDSVLALARWGLGIMAEQAGAGTVRSGWALLGVQALIDDSRAPDADEEYVFAVDGEVFTVTVRDGHAYARDGAATAPVMTVVTDAATMIDIGARKLDPVAGLVSGKVTVTTDDPQAMLRCLRLLGLYDADGNAARGSSGSALPAVGG